MCWSIITLKQLLNLEKQLLVYITWKSIWLVTKEETLSELSLSTITHFKAS